MERDILKKTIERMVREAMAAHGDDAELPAVGPQTTERPRFNFNSKENPRRIIAANWKMNMTTESAKGFAAGMGGMDIGDKAVVICPPIYLAQLLVRALSGTGMRIGAQNMHHEEQGAYTSEISPVMLKDAGCEYVILGHSERRHIFGERDEGINLKVISALNHGIIPILCVGETGAERERNATFRIVKNQLRLGLTGTTPNRARALVVAYEPVWAIGTGRTATPAQAQTVHAFIRESLAMIYDFSTAKGTRILYGGSVTPENARSLIKEKDIDGFLVGGASLSPDRFRKIIEVC